MIVIVRSDVSAAAKASQHGISPYQVYSHGFSGFAADITAKQLTAIRSDRDVIMVRSDRHRMYTPDPSYESLMGRGNTASPAVRTRPIGATPVERIAQVTTRVMRRVGILESPTASIDGVGGNANVDVAVIDTGIQVDHPDLNVVGGVNCSTGVGWSDVEGHGTQVAGVIAARDNRFGVVGVAPGARLWSVRAFDENNEADDSSILCAINWITDHADVIEVANMSFSGAGESDDNCGEDNADVIHFALCQSVRRGVTYVAAAGNEATDISRSLPAAYPEVMSVSGIVDSDGLPGGFGALDPCMSRTDDTFAPFSNFGVSVTIAAPAVCVSTTYIGSDVAVDSGTSFAAPVVSGAAALWMVSAPARKMLSKRPRTEHPMIVRRAIVDARERTAFAGDPDGKAEGVVSVRGF